MQHFLPWTKSDRSKNYSTCEEEPNQTSIGFPSYLMSPKSKRTFILSPAPSLAEDDMDTVNSPAQPPAVPNVMVLRAQHSNFEFEQRYTILGNLGEGSYSTVKQVTHRRKGGFYACKIVNKKKLSDVDRVALSHEVRVLMSVDHEHIMRLHEVIEDEDECYLIMELAENGDLFDRIVTMGKLPLEEAQTITGAMVEALNYCHTKNIIHRDIKPENVLLSDYAVKLCDFGFAKQLESSDEMSSESCGTPGYAAPEILDGKSYGMEVDIFSLGVVIYIMICGYPPFPMKLAQLRTHKFHVRFPAKEWSRIDTCVKDLIKKMLSVDPLKRPSARQLMTNVWIEQGRMELTRRRHAVEERRRQEELEHQKKCANAIRSQLSTAKGLPVVKYGRNGLPHQTSLRLTADGKTLLWQPKLLKRGLLKYRNAGGLTGLLKGHKDISVPEVHDSSDNNEESNDSSVSSISLGSSTSDGSNAINEKRHWWRSRKREKQKRERCNNAGPTVTLTRPMEGLSRSKSGHESASSSASVDLPDRLDNAIILDDIEHIDVGSACRFFTSRHSHRPAPAFATASSKRSAELSCVVSISTHFRDLHLEFAEEETRDGFIFLLQQIAEPLVAHPNRTGTFSSSEPAQSEADTSSEIDELTEVMQASAAMTFKQ